MDVRAGGVGHSGLLSSFKGGFKVGLMMTGLVVAEDGIIYIWAS